MRTSIRMMDVVRTSMPLVIAIGVLTAADARAANMDEVTVTAPESKTIGRSTNGAPIEEVSISEKVEFSPTMLQTNSGRALLEDKVTEVAQQLCTEAETPGSVPTEHVQACVKRAVKNAKEQIAAAAAKEKAG